MRDMREKSKGGKEWYKENEGPQGVKEKGWETSGVREGDRNRELGERKKEKCKR